VCHRLVDVFAWQLFPSGLQGDFQLINHRRLRPPMVVSSSVCSKSVHLRVHALISSRTNQLFSELPTDYWWRQYTECWECTVCLGWNGIILSYFNKSWWQLCVLFFNSCVKFHATVCTYGWNINKGWSTFLTYRVVLAYGKLQEHQSMFHYEEILWENDWLLRFIARAAETIWMFIAVTRISI